MTTNEEFLASLGSRHGLDDDRLFVGRGPAIQACVGLGAAVKLVWIWGARRVGKTSLAEKLERTFLHKNPHARVASVDASDAKSLDDVLTRAVTKLSGKPLASGVSVRDAFERIADDTRANAPLLLTVDEVDSLATVLGLDDQGFLRRLAGEDRHLTYVFVSVQDPYRIVEEVSDVASRLVGIATIQRVGQLELRDVETLFEVVGEGLARSDLEKHARATYALVGGHAASIMTLLQALACSPSRGLEAFDEVVDQKRRELRKQMAGLWGDLSPGTRTLLLDERAVRDDECRSEAVGDGFFDHRKRQVHSPTLLREVANALPSIEAEVDGGLTPTTALTLRLHDLVAEVNLSVKCKLGTTWFSHTDEVRRFHRAIRVVQSEGDLTTVVNHLHKVVYEAGREPDPSRDPKSEPMRWRVPEPYRPFLAGTQGMKALTALRNYFDHDPDFNRTPEDRADRHQKIGKVFERLCGTSWPETSGDWERAQVGLLRELVATFESLLAAVRNPPPETPAGR